MLSILVVISITEKGPIIFLSLGEKQIGQYDGIITPTATGKVEQLSDFNDRGYYLDFGHI